MRSMPCLTLVAVLTLATSASAWEPPLSDAPLARSASLLDARHGGSYRPGYHSSGSSDLVLNGLILVATGVVAGAAGFGLMAACPQNSGCYSDGLNTVAWVLAAPGIIPVVVGAFMIYLGSPNHRAGLLTPTRDRSWAFGFAPLPGGGSVGAAGRF